MKPDPDDILIWPAGFWCFRDELNNRSLRKGGFRVIHHFSDEWKKVGVIGLQNSVSDQTSKPSGLK